jgi:phytoene dehydrogenase-like protein
MHTLPGGQCCSWKRKGYTFDGCIHHLFGCAPGSAVNTLWSELGAMPREQVYTRECVAAVSPGGELFRDYWDLDELEGRLKEISPADSGVIDDYIKGIKAFSKVDFWGATTLGGPLDKAKMILRMLPAARWLKPTMRQFGDRFSDPFLKRAFPLLKYSMDFLPFMIHLTFHAYGLRKDIAWPVGASVEFSRSMEQRYLDLGGEVHYKSKVKEILVEGDRAAGVKLEDGSEHRADMVISNADGRKTIQDMLGGRYMDRRLREWCGEPDDEIPMAVQVFLGVDRDLSGEPSSLIMLLDREVTIAGHTTDSLEMQTYGFDRTMAPEGKGVIKVELFSCYSHWKKLYEDRERYKEEKEKVAEAVIDLLDANYFSGIKSQVEVVDVPTLMTWERFMGGTHGFANMPKKKMNIISSLFGKGVATLPGLSGFYLVGQWATSAGALFVNACSGRNTIETICKQDGRRFSPTP